MRRLSRPATPALRASCSVLHDRRGGGRWGGMGRVCLGTTGYFLLHGEKQADEDAAWGPVSLSFSLFTAKTTRRIHSGPCNTAVTPQPPPFTPHTELSTVFLSSDHLSFSLPSSPPPPRLRAFLPLQDCACVPDRGAEDCEEGDAGQDAQAQGINTYRRNGTHTHKITVLRKAD